MKAGTVIRWENFPDARIVEGELKARWFVHLGRSTALVDPVFLHLSTTTTQLHHFQKGGDRAKHAFCFLKASDTPFDQDCVIDLFEPPYSFTEEVLTGNTNIEFRGELTEQYLRQIYACVLRSPYFSRKVILDIHRSLNDIGVTGLKLP